MRGPIRSLFRRYLWLTGLMLSVVSIAAALGVARLAEEVESGRTERVIHHTLSGMLAPALAISDYAEVHRVLQLSTRDDYLIGAYTTSGDLLLSDYTRRDLFTLAEHPTGTPTDCNTTLTQTPPGWKASCSEFSWGTLRSLYRRSPLPIWSERSIFLLTLLLLVLGGTLAVLRNFLGRSILAPIEQLTDAVGKAHLESESTKITVLPAEESAEPQEIGSLRAEFNRLLVRIQEQLQAEQEATRTRAVALQAQQVAHDVASPLGALEMIVQRAALPPDHQDLMKLAVGRIRSIVSDLRKVSRRPGVGSEPLASNLQEVILEKKAQSSPEIQFEFRGFDQYRGLTVRSTPDDLKRVLSNVIGNSIEAGAQTITFEVQEQGDRVFLNIEDNGRGFPKEYFERAFEKGLSLGKPDGSGLGLYHARQCLKAWDGDVALESTAEGKTRVRLRFATDGARAS